MESTTTREQQCDQYALVSNDGRLLDYIEAKDIFEASDLFADMLGYIPDGAYVTNLTKILEPI